jgi:hypothetical protein
MADRTDLKAVYTDKVKERLALHPNQWTGEDSARVVEAYISSLTDEKGKPIILTALQKDVINLISRPTFDVQVRLVKRLIEDHGVKFDADTEKRIKDLVNPTTFKRKLIEGGHIKGTGDEDVLG